MAIDVLFLDIDGVLNNHVMNAHSESNTLLPECVEEFNRILLEVQPRVILSSAWRYMVSAGAMTLPGFAYMLRTHGVHKLISQLLYGVTRSDEVLPTRGSQIRRWLDDSNAVFSLVRSFVVLDDAPAGMCFNPVADRLVKTDGNVGLTETDADRVIEMLRRGG